MNAAVAILLLALAAPDPAQASPPKLPANSAQAKVPAQSFERISQEAIKAFDESRNDEAIPLLQAGLKQKPDWNEGLLCLGTVLYEKERFGEARDVLRHFVAQNPKHGPGWVVLGMSEFKTREYERALDHLQRAMSMGVGDRKQLADTTFFHVAVLLNRFEHFHDSLKLLWEMRGAGSPEEMLQEAAGLSALGYPLLPQEIPADRRELARLAGAGTFALLDQRRADAEKLFSKMVERYPNEPGVHYQYGLLLLDDRPEAGVQEMLKEIEISPSQAPARLRLAEYYLRVSSPEKAKPYVNEVLGLDSKNASGHMLLGEVLASSGDIAGAIRELEMARDLAPTRANIRWDLLRAYTAAGRREDAEREKVEIQKLNKDQN